MNQPIFLNILLTMVTLVLAIAFVTYQIQRIGWLKHHGKHIVATVTSIRHEMGKTPAGYSSDNYYVTAKWTNPRTGRTYNFWTWVINRCPEYVQGSLVPVLIDPNDPQKYTVEI